VRLLLDTQLVLWWEMGSSSLPAELTEFVDEAEAVFISRASLWEIAIKVSIGKLRLNVKKFAENIDKHGFDWLDITNAHLFTVAKLAVFEDHRDSFDRLLVAQSRSEPLLLLTADNRLARYGETVKVLN
jgi:PIN domain nuclease of toxin-antitoxin system